jgi:hypothetical protein
MEKTTLTEAFGEFLEDLKNVDSKIVTIIPTHEEIKSELLKVKNVDMKNLFLFDISVGQIYSTSGTNTKKCIFKHLEVLNKLCDEPKICVPDTTDLLNSLPIANVLTSGNLDKLASLVSQHKQDSDSVVDVLRKVVNSPEFEKVTADLTKGLKI